jgi:hypothetical protein
VQPSRRSIVRTFALVGLVAAVALAGLLRPEPAGAAPAAEAPTILALLEPADGAELTARERPTFAWEATPGGRFRVEFSAGSAPFLPVVTSGRRTTPGDRFKPSAKQWRLIRAVAPPGAPIHWRVVVLGMSPDEMASVPVASFVVRG